MHTVVLVSFIALLLIGVGLAFIPAFPALFLMFVFALVYGFIDSFVHLTVHNILILGGIVALGFVVDTMAGLIGAKYGGASKKAILWGIVGIIIGFIIFPPFGALLGLFVGVLCAELYQLKSKRDALKAAGASVAGSLTGMAVNIILALTFLILFIFFAFN